MQTEVRSSCASSSSILPWLLAERVEPPVGPPPVAPVGREPQSKRERSPDRRKPRSEEPETEPPAEPDPEDPKGHKIDIQVHSAGPPPARFVSL